MKLSRKSNTSGRDAVQVNLNEQLEIYDSLPARIRRLVDQAPRKQEMKTVKNFVDVLGEQPALEEIVRQWETRFPGWRFEP